MTCFEWAEYYIGDRQVLALDGRIDTVSVQQLKRRLRIMMRNSRTAAAPIIDMTGLTYLDPCGAQALADAARLLHPSKQITIHGANHAVRGILGVVTANTFLYEPAQPTPTEKTCERRFEHVIHLPADRCPFSAPDQHQN